MLCRSKIPAQVSRNGHLSKVGCTDYICGANTMLPSNAASSALTINSLNKTIRIVKELKAVLNAKVLCLLINRRVTQPPAKSYFTIPFAKKFKALLLCASISAITTPLLAQTPSAADNPGQLSIDAQLRPWLANIEHTEPSLINIATLDSRIKIEPCNNPIKFDFPFSSHKTVRAVCVTPPWQYYLQVTFSQPAAGNNASNLNKGAQSSQLPVSTKPSPSLQSNAASAPAPLTSPVNPAPTTQSTPARDPPPPSSISPPRNSTTALPPPNAKVQTVLISPQFLKRGTILDAGMFVGTEIASQPGDLSALSNPKDLDNMELLRDLPANTPIKSFDLKPMVMIKRGQQVIVTIGEGKGFLISVRAEALQDGRLGDQVRLKNTESGRSISAVVTGINTAKAL